MNASQNVDPTRGDWFVRAAEFAGDLGSPFYREERQREVWNEGCAVGLQVALWLGLAASAVTIWSVGAPALPYAVSLLGILTVAAAVAIGYASVRGVRLGQAGQALRLRLVPFGVLLVVFLVGAMRAAPPMSSGAGFAQGMAVGSSAAVLWLLWTGLRARRPERHDGAVGRA